MGLSTTDASSLWARSTYLVLALSAVQGRIQSTSALYISVFSERFKGSLVLLNWRDQVPWVTLFQQQQCYSWNKDDLLETSQVLFSFTGSKIDPEFLANFGDYHVLPTEQITDGTTWNWEFESLSLLCEVSAHFSCDNHWAAEWFGELPVQKNSWKYLT